LTTLCENTIGSYRCRCKEKGFSLIPGQTTACQDVNECIAGVHNCDPSSEICHNTIGGFICNCSNGYTKKGDICVPLSDCDEGALECGANAFCVKRPSRDNPNQLVPQCVCQDGYYVRFLIGRNPENFCDPIAECENDSQCAAHSHCIQTQALDTFGAASYKCVCDNGFRRVGSACEPINECEENLGICGYNAICVDMLNLYKCVCRAGTINVGT
uniref:Dumpy n=1 Tax=Anisakis simplex TaxID=6269 RepID=A0A0M3J3B6_ANISI